MLGFVGNTGDAFTTDPHLHFEVHPNSLLFLGYDGAVDPTTYLAQWRRPARVKVLPPVVLPPQAHVGQGSITDYQRLLALHPLPRAPQPAKPLPPLSLGTQAVGVTPFERGSDSSAALVAGALLLLLAAAAVGATAWNGRRR